MNHRLFSVLPFLACFAQPAGVPASEPIHPENGGEWDVVVYGGISGAVTAAVRAKSMGKSVVVVCPDKHLGGMSASGLGFTDSGKTATIGGLAREFYRRVYRAYDNDAAWTWQQRSAFSNTGQATRAMCHDDQTMWTFEPRVAERIFEQWIAENGIPVFRGAFLDRGPGGVAKEGARIKSIRTLDGKTFAGRMFIDATYEGDLMAAAGVSYAIGREPNSQYGETWNGNQPHARQHGHWFMHDVSPYRVAGKPESGLLPYVVNEPAGEVGVGDRRIQAYCYRLCLTNHPANRVPFMKPAGYDPEQYELLRRVLAAGWREVFEKFDPVPNAKTDTNNHGPFSSDFIGMNYDYPEASYERRSEIADEHRRYQMGLFHFLANDPGVPADVREQMGAWGYAGDEFADNDHWPRQLYVREARRLVGEYIMTERECLATLQAPRPVGMGSYALDSHNVRRYVTENGFAQNEGDVGVHPAGPYGIDFGSLLPRKVECENLLVPTCVGSSHIAYGSIRMEPVFMILGDSAATAAALALDLDCAAQDVPYERLKARLLQDGQILTAP